MLTIIQHRLLKHGYRAVLKQLNKMPLKKGYTYYFAYGANLSIDRFKKFSIIAEEIGPACLKNYQLKYNLPCEYLDKGYAGVIPSEEKEVWGTLFKVENKGMTLLDILEWVPFNMYYRTSENVECDGKNYPEVNFYITKYPRDNLFAPTNYHNFILTEAKKRSFPQSYINHLEELSHKSDFKLNPKFNLAAPNKDRFFSDPLRRYYLIHDRIREKLCEII